MGFSVNGPFNFDWFHNGPFANGPILDCWEMEHIWLYSEIGKWAYLDPNNDPERGENDDTEAP